MGFMKTEDKLSVGCLLRNVKHYITEGGIPLTPEVVTFDVAYPITTPVKDLSTTSHVMLEEYHIDQNKRRHVLSFSR